MIQSSEAEHYCRECDDVTLHKDGKCVECAHDRVQEQVAWSRLLRKVFAIACGVAGLVVINWALAQQWSGDDMTRAALGSIVTAIVTWFSTSLKSEEKIRSGGAT